MTNILKINHKARTIVMDRTFEKNASVVGSDEYNLLQSARKDYPKYRVNRRQIKKNKNKKSYSGLTYEFMENYILSHNNADAIYAEYLELRLIAQCHSISYPQIKKWFLNTYKEVADFGKFSNDSDDSPETNASSEKVTDIKKNTTHNDAA